MSSVQRGGRRRALPTRKHFKKISTKKSVDSEAAINVVEAEDLASLQQRVQRLVDTFKFEEAKEVCAKAVALAPEDADLQYLMGSICLEVGDFINGFEHIRNSIHLQPETTPDRFFAFAQLLSGADALQVYEHGLQVFFASEQQPSAEMSKKVSTACCSAAEIFMTDLCDEEGAEVSCEEWLIKAAGAFSANAEYFRVLADLRMCQERPEEARVAVMEAVRLWNAELETLLNPVEEQSVDLLVELPSYDSRIAAAKILIEVSELESAVSVLEQLLKEDDGVLMTWYLLCFALGASSASEAAEACKDAIYGALRVARREGLFLDFEALTTDDDLLLEILNFAKERQLSLDDLDSLEVEGVEAEAQDLEEIIAEVEQRIKE